MTQILTRLYSVFRKKTDREKEFLSDLKACCNKQRIEWLFKKINSRIKRCCINGHLDIIVTAPEGDWGDEVFNVRYNLSKKYGEFIRADQRFRHKFDWCSAANPLIIHWEIQL